MATLRGAVVHRSWLSLLAIAVILLMIVFGTTPVEVRPLQGVEQAQVGKPAVQSVQPVPEIAAPVIQEWPRVEVVWSEPFLINSLADLPPSLPAGKGFYRETPDGIASGHSSKEAEAYFRKILPGFGPSDTTLVPAEAIGGIARDPANPDIVLAGFHKAYANPNSRVGERDGESYGFLFLSIDGERSWYEISSFVPDPWRNIPVDIRVARNEDKLTMFARDPSFVAPMWRKAVLPLTSLP